MKPVPMSGQTGQPQTAIWSVADAIMASTFGEEIDAEEGIVDDAEDNEPKVADWDTWNTPRYDVERFYQRGGGMTEAMYYHASSYPIHAGRRGQPLFLAYEMDDIVHFYGDVVSLVDVQHVRAANENTLRHAIEELGITKDDVVAVKGDFQDIADFLYVPAVQKKLEEWGYDAYSGKDILTNEYIDIMVVWDPAKYEMMGIIKHGKEHDKFPSRVSETAARGYLEYMTEAHERLLRRYIRGCIAEVNAISTGGGGGADAGNIRGVVTPLGAGPEHPKKKDKKGSKKRNKRRLELGADAFGGGEFVDE